MLLKNLLENLENEVTVVNSNDNLNISGLSFDSRRVEIGNLFIAVKGQRFNGAEFIEEAVSKGANSLLLDVDEAEKIKNAFTILPVGFSKNTRELMPKLAARFYDFPSKDLKVIGITGTNGKTTTCYLVEFILRKAGFLTALLGTVVNRINDRLIIADHTTSEAIDLQKALSDAREAGVSFVIMEVSSHGIHQRRVDEIDFYLKALTNITQDHLDYHRTFEEYRQVKLNWLSQGNGLVVLPEDFKNEIIPQNFPLLGMFNYENAKLAAAITRKIGIDENIITAALGQVQPPSGRFEQIDCGQDFLVIVDYAHTPDGLQKILSACRDLIKIKKSAKIITVFGCGGDRDRKKRPLMGKIASQFSDYIILTSDNPRNEDPEKIIEEIEEGIDKNQKYDKIVDRREAIEKAISLAQKDDLVLIVGKGHEQVQIFNDRTVNFSDQEIAGEFLNK